MPPARAIARASSPASPHTLSPRAFSPPPKLALPPLPSSPVPPLPSPLPRLFSPSPSPIYPRPASPHPVSPPPSFPNDFASLIIRIPRAPRPFPPNPGDLPALEDYPSAPAHPPAAPDQPSSSSALPSDSPAGPSSSSPPADSADSQTPASADTAASADTPAGSSAAPRTRRSSPRPVIALSSASSSAIEDYLRAHRGVDLDAALSPAERAELTALRGLVETTLSAAAQAELWGEERNRTALREMFDAAVPWPLSRALLWREARNQGWGEAERKAQQGEGGGDARSSAAGGALARAGVRSREEVGGRGFWCEGFGG
ncbi:unnamed protein product [Closterium sp. Yama58-4]|nr:unnamed protein product [Closterium sp. Yama58-4]